MDLLTYSKLDAMDIAQSIQQKEMKPSEFVELSLQQLNKVNPLLNIVTNTRKDKVLDEAKTSLLGESPLSGVPLLLKNISQTVKGEPITSGAQLFKNVIATHDSNFVTRLRNAGLLFVGHTNSPEFGLKNITEPVLHGQTRNPWNADYSPGGSSGGSAAAIASGVVPVAGASDGGGSIRIPASFTSLFGLKPTRGRTPVGPGVGRQWQGASIDFVLSKSVRDSAAMLDLLQVIQPSAAFQTPLFPRSYNEVMKESFGKKLKIAFSIKSPVGTEVSEDAEQAVKKTIKWLEELGHEVYEVDNGIDGVQLMEDYYLMNSGEIATVFNGIERSIGRKIQVDDVEIESWLLNEAGKSVSAAQFSESLSSWDTAAEKMAIVHETYDFYITPSTAFTAPKIGELTHSHEQQHILRDRMSSATEDKKQSIIYEMFLPSLTYTPYTQLANLTGQPAMSVPVHMSKDGLPLGVQVMASKGDEHRLLQLAYQLEQSELWVGMNGNPYLTN
ncbi:amidase [Sporosarcina siberiensis]|uniref:Amidase n=1 Tax=Sporosarcina siberiensis TaxID=1365606 RepID=A0ABW4SF21_9BACL